VPDLSRDNRGFTLIELIASITIIAILAVVALPSATMATPFREIGYADVITASLRQARAVAIATTCDVQFTIDDNGYRAFQRGASGSHCALAGAFTTPVLSGTPPSEILPAAARTLVFLDDGRLASAATTTINLGPKVITIDAGGVVVGP
jgi:prepilin-type N-terminal cleavage/methylation domain-containing protein